MTFGAAGGVMFGAVGGVMLGAAGGVMLGAVGGLKLGAGGGLKPGTAGQLKLGTGGGLKLGTGGGLKLGAVGGLKPKGFCEALGAALVAGAGCDVVEGAGVAVPVDAVVIGSGFVPVLVFPGAASRGPPPFCARCTPIVGVSALLDGEGGDECVAVAVVVFVAFEGGVDSVLPLGSVGGVEDEEPESEPEHAASACITAAVESA